MNQAVVSRLRELLAEIRPQFAEVPLDPDGDLVQRLGLDSLDVSNLIVEVEAEYEVRVDLARLPELNTLNKLAAYVAEVRLSLDFHAIDADPTTEQAL